MVIVIILLCMIVLVTLASSSQIQSEKHLLFDALADDTRQAKKKPGVGLKGNKEDFSRLPGNFSFSIIWNRGTVSSYNSADGRLISEGSEHGVRRRLTRNEKKAIREILSGLKLSELEGDIYSSSKSDCKPILTLTVRCGRATKTISLPTKTNAAEDADLCEYIDACDKIINIIIHPGDMSRQPVLG